MLKCETALTYYAIVTSAGFGESDGFASEAGRRLFDYVAKPHCRTEFRVTTFNSAEN